MTINKPSKAHPWRKTALATTGEYFQQWEISKFQAELNALRRKGVRNSRAAWLQATINTYWSQVNRATGNSGIVPAK